MEAKIIQKLVNAKLKVGFYCMIGTDKLKVVDIEGNIATMDNGNQYNADELKPYVIRYSAVIQDKNKHEYYLDYIDYKRVSEGQVLEGYIVSRARNVHAGDIIRITDIDIIDKNKEILMDINLRKGEIIRILPNRGFDVKYEVQMEATRNLLHLTRDQFILFDRYNTKKYFHVKCPECEI